MQIKFPNGTGGFPFGRRPDIVDAPKPPRDMKKFTRSLFAVLIAAIVLVGVGESFYSVREQEQAVVTMFGNVIAVRSAGLYFKVPWLQRAHIVDTTTHGLPIGYTTSSGRESDPSGATTTSEASMITSDFNFVDIDFYLEYRVSDPVKYLYASSDPENILRNIAQASIRSTVVKYTVDDVITTAKGQIQAEVKERMLAELEDSDVGLTVVNITIQDAEPPTAAVIEAFKAVETAKQGADTAVNNAKKYQSEQIPAAEAEADRIKQEAEAQKASRIAEAEGQVERFNKMYEEYAKYPLITRQRIFYETMEEVLPSLKIIIDNGSTETLLPIESFSR